MGEQYVTPSHFSLTPNGLFVIFRRKYALMLVTGIEDTFELKIGEEAAFDHALWDFDPACDRRRHNGI